MTFFFRSVTDYQISRKRKSRKSASRTHQCSQGSCGEDGEQQQQQLAANYPTITDLPSHVLIDILSRLPLKAILTSRCVSKTWHTLISDRHFAKLHLDRANVELFLRTDYSTCISRTLHWVDRESCFPPCPSAGNCYSRRETEISVRFHLPKRNRKDKTSKPRELEYQIVNSCNGFICLRKPFMKNPCIICNPITGEYIAIPKSEQDDNTARIVLSGFGHCMKSNQYKVLRLFFNKFLLRIAEVYTLGTASWRGVGYASRAPVGGHFATYLNGVIHWACDDFYDNTSDFIVAFDFEDERFFVVPAPPHFGEKQSKRQILENMNMGVLGGCLCVCDVTYSVHLDIWIMKDYGVQDSWTKQFSINNYCPGLCQPIMYFGNEGVLIFYRRWALILYNPVDKNIRYLSIHEAESIIFEAITHVPSFLSLQDVVGGDVLKVKNSKSRCSESEPQEEAETLLLVERGKSGGLLVELDFW